MRPMGERGASTLELALIAPLLITMMVVIVEIGYAMTVDALLNYAARVAARGGFTGQVASGATDRRAGVCDAVRQVTQGVLDQTRLTISSHAYASFSALSQTNGGLPPPASLVNLGCGTTNWDTGQNGAALGQSGQVVVYVIDYAQPVLTGLGQSMFGRTEIIHEARLAVRNEPFMTGN